MFNPQFINGALVIATVFFIGFQTPNIVADTSIARAEQQAPTPQQEISRGDGTGWWGAISTRFRGGNSEGIPASISEFVTEFTEQRTVIGRENAYRQVGMIFESGKANNAMVLGEAGEGKTYFAEGLKSYYSDHRVFFLDLGGLMSGQNGSHDIPRRLKQLFAELDRIAQHERVILVIDEIHRITGINQGENSLAEQLKIPLNNPNVRVMGLTTKKEFDMYIATDEALIRRFQNYVFEPITRSEMLTILQFESTKIMNEVRSDNIRFMVQDGALELILDKGTEFVARRNPMAVNTLVLDKAKSILAYEAKHGVSEVSELRISLETIQGRLVFKQAQLQIVGESPELLREISELTTEKNRIQHEIRSHGEGATTLELDIRTTETAIENAKNGNRWAEIPVLQDHLMNLEARLQAEQGMTLQETRAERVLTIDRMVIARAMSSLTGGVFSEEIILGNDNERLRNLMEFYTDKVIGHEEAKRVLHESLKIAGADIMRPNGSQGVVVLDGMSGNGKSTLAEVTAEGLGRDFKRFYMTDFTNSGDVWKLIGSGIGYEGNKQGGILTNAIEQSPRLVMELAEFNKASQEVKNIFYQAFEDGVLKDGRGREVSVKHVLFIITMNTSADYLAMKRGSALRMNFEREALLASKEFTAEQIESLSDREREKKVMEQLQFQDGFDKALQGRLTANIATEALTPAQAILVARAMLKAQFVDYLKNSQDVNIKFSDAVYNEVAKYGYDPKYGARSLKTIIRDHIAKPLSDLKMTHGLKSGDVVNIDVTIDRRVEGIERLEFKATKNGVANLSYTSLMETQIRNNRSQVAEQVTTIDKPRSLNPRERILEAWKKFNTRVRGR